jgi:hypothetical protein
VNLKNKPPIFVPDRFRTEIEKLSKAALMDMVWDYAMQIGCSDGEGLDFAMEEFRRRRDIILAHRGQVAA